MATRERSAGGAGAAGLLYAVILFLCLLQQPGRVTLDTRVELTERPIGFLGEAFRLWQPTSNFGELQNQAYGYLFPQGPWFVLVRLVHAPEWVGQRVWMALVLVVACEGVRRVASYLGLGPACSLLAGATFMLSPRLLGTVPVISAESLPGALMPWVILPVLLAVHGKQARSRAAILSGAAAALMGGVNAVETSAALLLPVAVVVWFLVRGRLDRRFALMWAGCLALATLWWIAPLLVLSRYAPPFYEYVESASNTTSVIGWSEAVRGDTAWVAYIGGGGAPTWPAGYALATHPLLVVTSAIVAALGMVGLALHRSCARVPMVVVAGACLGLVTVAHGGAAGSILAGPALHVLDGGLQLFRNVHKFDPAIRLPIAIGVGELAQVVMRESARRWPAFRTQPGFALVVPAALLACLLQPMVLNESRTPGWHRLPQAWTEAARYLRQHADGRATLIVPGTGFAQQTWGWTMDDPSVALDIPGRVSLSQVPLVPGQSIRFLSALNQLVTSGRATAGLTQQLARAGIGHVLVRRDLDRGLTGSPAPGGVDVSLASASLSRVASFGAPADQGPQIDVFRVPGPSPRLGTTAVDQVRTVAGEPESILSLLQLGLVQPAQATVLAGEPGWHHPAEIVTDEAQRRERAFGSIYDSLSAVMQEHEKFRVPRAVHDYTGAPGASPVFARYSELSRLIASSSQGFADTYGAVTPQAAPYAAVDGNLNTRWVSSPASDPVKQWVRMDLSHARRVREVRVLAVADDPSLAPIRSLTVRVGAHHRQVPVDATGATAVARFPDVLAKSIEVRIRAVAGPQHTGAVALREIAVDGLRVRRTLVVPHQVPTTGAFALSAVTGVRACSPTVAVPDCDVSRIRASEEPDGVDRTVRFQGGAYRMQGYVVARGTRAAARYLEPVDPSQRVAATSVYGSDPRVSSRFAYDADPSTVWISDDRDENPTLTLRWSRPRHVSGLRIVGPADGQGAPGSVVVRSRGSTQHVTLAGDALVHIRPVTTRFLQLTFPLSSQQKHVVVAEVGLQGVRVSRPFDPTGTVELYCGFGPNVEVDDRRYPTSVEGTLGDIVDGSPMTWQVCRSPGTGAADVTFSPGTHRIVALPSSEFDPMLLSGQATGASTAPATSERSVDVLTWSGDDRTARIGPGPSTVLWDTENYNAGWSATMHGRRLVPIRVDGWRQGWLVPAGGAGVVHLRFTGQRTYEVVLGGGLVGLAALLLGAVAVLALGRRRAVPARRQVDPDPPWSPRWTAVGVVVAAALLGFVFAFAMALGLLDRPRHRIRHLVVGGALVAGSGVLDALAGGSVVSGSADVLAASGAGLLFAVMTAGAGRGEP